MVLRKLTETVSFVHRSARIDTSVQPRCATSGSGHASKSVSDSLSSKDQALISKTSHLGRASRVEDGSSKRQTLGVVQSTCLLEIQQRAVIPYSSLSASFTSQRNS